MPRDEEVLRQFREDMYETTQTYRQVIGDEQILCELIGSVCAHICTSQIITQGEQLDALIESFRTSLTLALGAAAEVRLYHEQGVRVWPTEGDIDA
mgnify:CR=1 FL=1|tara:strand:+ start:97 stop:384 length:288 start_codon:yes stop_codon:yes gene_type:complete